MSDLTATTMGQMPGLNIFAGVIQSLKPKMTQFKDAFEQMLKQLGVDEETRDRLRKVVDSGRDQDMTAKLDELVRGTLVDKDGLPIELKNAEGEPVRIDREGIGELAKKYGIKSDNIDPSMIGPQEWEETDNADDPSSFKPLPTQWVRG